jgi:hypothetical protein
MYGPPDGAVRYLRIHPRPINLPNTGYLGYGAPPIAAVHPAAPSVGEYNGWVSLAKVAMVELGIANAVDTTDILDSSFTDAVFAFQEEYGKLFGLEPTGYLDPETTKALSTVYEQVFGSVPPLAPVYLDDQGELVVGYPTTKKKGSGWGTAIAIGLLGLGFIGTIYMIRR